MLLARLIFLVAILLASPALASAQLRFPQPIADLGELRGGPVYDQRFEFVNDSATPLEIVDIRLGCGCLQPVLDKRVIAAGEKGSLRLNIRTLGQSNGTRTWQAHVQYRQGTKTSETTLILAATIRNEVTVEPSILAMAVENTLKQEVTITDLRKTPLKVTAVLPSSQAIRVATQTTDGGVTRVTLEISGAALTASRQEEMLTICTDDPYYRQLQVPVTLMKATRAEVTASPAKVEITGAGSQLVRLRASGDKSVRVEKADCDQAGVKCTWAAGPGNDATLRISATAQTADAIVRVRLVEPAGATVAIPVTLRKD